MGLFSNNQKCVAKPNEQPARHRSVAPQQVLAKQNHAAIWRTCKECSISLPSLRQHYLVAMATSLNKLENKVQIHHLHIKRFHMVKKIENWSSISNDIRLYMPVLAVSYQTYANRPCHLWSYQAEVHRIFRRCSPIISAVNAHSQTMILQFVFQHQCKYKWYQSTLIIFATLFGCHGNVL